MKDHKNFDFNSEASGQFVLNLWYQFCFTNLNDQKTKPDIFVNVGKLINEDLKPKSTNATMTYF